MEVKETNRERKYKFNNSVLKLIFGDIMDSKAEVIVSSDDTGISMAGGVSKVIREAGGDIIREDAPKKLPAQVGDVIVSTAGSLEHQKYVFHCLTLNYEHKFEVFEGKLTNSEEMNKYIIRHSIDKCFRLMQALDLHSISFPCIGVGLARIPIKQLAINLADVISSNLFKTQKPYEIELYLYESTGYDHNRQELSEMDYIDMFENFAIKAALYQYESERKSSISVKCTDVRQMPKVQEIPKREEMHHQVFISYSRKDAEAVNAIRDILEQNGISYWIDKEGIFSGENYKEVIVDAIETAKAVIFVSSVNSNASINVIRELGYAVKQRRTIIPIMLDDTPYAKSVRLDISDIHQIEFKNDTISGKEIVTSVLYVLGLAESE